MIDRAQAPPLTRQTQQLGISRGSIYYLPRAVPNADLAIMRRIDELHLLSPFAGSGMLRDLLRQKDVKVGRLHVATLMKRMRIEAIDRRPNTSKPVLEQKIYSYLLRKLAVTRPNQVWATDITYVPIARGVAYLVAIVNWFSRRVLAWHLSISLDARFCIEVLEEVLARHGRPAIVNSDQGSQFTSAPFHRRPPPRRDRHQYGQQGLQARQRVRVVPLALGEIRRGVPQRLCIGPRGSRRHRPLHRLLQCRQATLGTWQPHARPDILLPAASRSGMINPRQST